ncbi:TetR-like C-terminal domain-containing protein [Streptomyces spirodelae]|uniref:TetR/AcrR family transcriptional regulator C-terminal ligand-binding domain-containing protein n=1 Tax=Streptomyces spirodelae TaxID=2812904 RepID=A0ABS3WU53_9ACTN|nr:TetR-like C-terminal domain-containing protein [Streptomyces spirodelae]MBO8186632.1 TetR/AcrR family transcriptional regulator C-terminal ligand-binding domain-containing protein [Streptomyces spirodelae]
MTAPQPHGSDRPAEPARPHGSTRPGGRTARTRAAVLAAAWEELDRRDFASLTIDLIAQRSGVHAATIRRRWRTVEGVISDILSQHGETIPVPDTGSLRQDLHALARSIADFYTPPRNQRLVEAVVTAAVREPGAAEVLHNVFGDRIRRVAVMVERAAERGEVAADTDGEEVIAALGAPFYYRLLMTRRPVDAELAHRSAEAAYLAAVEGVFRTGRRAP